MLQLEIKDGMIFLSTTDRRLCLKAIEFMAKEYKRLEARDRNQVTVLDYIRENE
jgi:hypothetical protein